MSSDNFHFVGPFGELWTNLSASEFVDIDGLALYFYLDEYGREPQRCSSTYAARIEAEREYSEYGTSVCYDEPDEQPLDIRLEAEVRALRQRIKYLDSVALSQDYIEERVDRLERLTRRVGEALDLLSVEASASIGSRKFSWPKAVSDVDFN